MKQLLYLLLFIVLCSCEKETCSECSYTWKVYAFEEDWSSSDRTPNFESQSGSSIDVGTFCSSDELMNVQNDFNTRPDTTWVDWPVGIWNIYSVSLTCETVN